MGLQLVTVLVAIGVGILVIGLVVLLWLRRLLGRMASTGEARALAMAGAGQPIVLIEPRALSFGFQSLGVTQSRGNGCLALTPERLVFAMWIPARDVAIDRRDILAVDTATSHLGKTQLVPLLRVRFRTPEGGEDVAAWRLADLSPWLVELGARPNG